MCATVSQLAVLFVAFGPASPAAAALPPSEWVVGAQKRVVYLTLDGQTSARHLAAVRKTLDDKGVDATFFISGGWISHHPDKARALRRDGNLLGNRGWGRERFTSLSDDALRSSIVRSQDALNEVGATPRPFLRAPKGARDLRVLRIAGALGYRSVRWTYKARGGLADKVARKVVGHAQAGAIVSLDIWRKSHRKALGRIIGGLRRHGYELRTIAGLERTHAVRWDVTLRSGSSGTEVAYLQKKLNSTSYPVTRTGLFGYATLESTYAFEKVHRMARDGVVTPSEMTAIATSTRPRAPKRSPHKYIDIDISRQVMFEVRGRRVTHTTPISSGNEEYYSIDGQTYKAHTPRGSFTIERKISGWRTSRLGRLWYPSYFVGGFAIHGSDSVPTYPASHGCVRIPMYATRPFYDRSPIGTHVFVHN